MFESLQESLSGALRAITGQGRLTEQNMREGLRKVQNALLEADVSFSVVQQFMARVTEQAIGETVLKALNPTQQLVGIVYKELVGLMGPVDHSLHLRPGVNVLMLCGLQGSGKTTTCGKLARTIKEHGRHPMLVAADLQRPAAIDQLEVIGGTLGVPVHVERGERNPVVVCQNAVRQAKMGNVDVLILDTAGRLHVDTELMQQLTHIEQRVEPSQVYLVVDGMTGQDAVNSSKVFNEALELDGLIMTKLDGDARGGAALSVKSVTGVPIKYMGTGEHLDALEEFHPERMAQRILGMGDILTLVETAKKKFDQEEMQKQEERLKKGEFTLDDFARLLGQTSRLGPLSGIVGMIPGMGQMMKAMGETDVDMESEVSRLRAIVNSMTPAERRNPSKVIDQSRRRRIAAGAGVEPHQVNELVKQFDTIAAMMKGMSSLGARGRFQKMQELMRGMDPRGRLPSQKKGTGKRLTKAEKDKMRKDREKLKRQKFRDRKNPNGESEGN